MKNKASIIGLVVVLVAVGAVLTYKSGPKVEEKVENIQKIMDKSSMVAQNGDMVSVKYTGKLKNGTVFDSTEKHGGTPIQFVLGASMVIKGWDEGVLGMKIGEKKVLDIPAEKAYGPAGIPDGLGGYLIPPNSTLVFDVELTDIDRKATETK